MTRQQAYEAMKQGHKITHSNFSDDEWYEYRDNCIFAEDGVEHTRVFRQTDQDNWRADGWEIYQEPVIGSLCDYIEHDEDYINDTPEYPDTDRWNIDKKMAEQTYRKEYDGQ